MPGFSMKTTSREGNINPEIQSLYTKISSYMPAKDRQLVEKAYAFSKAAHTNQYRKTGEPFIQHPVEVASILADMNLDVASIVAGLLHDVVEDTSITLHSVKEHFGWSVAEVVDGLTKLSQVQFKNDYQKESENIRKMLISMSKDVRVILVKLADRLHNMRTLDALSENRQLRIANETLNIYAPLAGRLGLNPIKVELEDLAFKYIYPEAYLDILKQFEKEKIDREKYIKDVIHFLTEDLSQKTRVKFEIRGRTKNIYSIYRKMQAQNVDYDQVYDIIAFRICTEKIHECYELLGWVHSLWKPIPGRFKDFIAIPKSNNYQSLHTTVIGPQGRRVEIQIRTYNMHKIAERGVATHWKYKEESYLQNTSIRRGTMERFEWLQDLVALHQHNKHSSEFLENVKHDLFETDVYIFTPKGDVKELAVGSTPIDFAFALHTDLGLKLKEAKVNGAIASIKEPLKSGDVVEISTSKNCSPKREWLDHCVTSKARSRIRSYIRDEDRKSAINMGKKIFEKELKDVGLKPDHFFEKPESKETMVNMGLNTLDDVYSQIGYGKIIAKNFIYKIIGKSIEEQTSPTITSPSKVPEKKKGSSISVEGIGDVIVNVAQCCTPLPGEDIMGYISMERGIVVHRCECKMLLKLDSDRFVDVDWKKVDKEKHRVTLEIMAQDSPGVLKELSHVFNENGVNIVDIKAQTHGKLKAQFFVRIEIEDIQGLRSIMGALKQLKVVNHVSRVSSMQQGH